MAIERARDVLGRMPKTPFEQGLEQTIAQGLIAQAFAKNRRREQLEKARQDIKLCRSIIGIEIAIRDFAIGDAHGSDEDRALIINVEVALHGEQQNDERNHKK
jgi:hypothetical protein